MNDIQNIKIITEKLNRYRESYYNNSTSIISDFEYDKLFDELVLLEKKTGFSMSNSPTKTVGYEVKSKLVEVTHNHPMLSLDKTKSVKDLENFIDDNDCLLMLKLDGLTCSIKYLNGILVSAETRGNGEIGEDITHNAKVLSNIPLTIPYLGEFIVDGEAIITYENFNKINDSLPPDKEKYKTPRNLAAGSIRQLDSKIAKERNVEFVAWKCVKGLEGNSFSEQLHQLLYCGFDVVPNRFILKYSSSEYLEKIIEELKSEAKICDYPIDGLVIGYEDIAYGLPLGATNHHVRSQLAFKFEDELVSSKLLKVEFSVGKTGVITPVAVFDSVEIEGTNVNRASLHNISVMESLNVLEGCTVNVYKANQIIPQVLSCSGGEGKILPPSACPVCNCNTTIKETEGTKILVCTNKNCIGVLNKKLTHFVSKKCMNIKYLSEATIEKLCETSLVKCFSDLYKLEAKDFSELDKMGEISAEKIIKNIELSKDSKISKFLAALSIPNIGSDFGNKIEKFCTNDINKFYSLIKDNFDFSTIDGVGTILNRNIYDWFNDSDNRKEFEKLISILVFQVNNMNDNISESLKGKVFVITGSVYRYKNRDELKNEIETLGGKVAGRVSKNTDFLINNDKTSTSGKNAKAIELGIKIINEEEYISLK